ncbi:hypothetical protein ACIO52_15150 [Nocardia sp. NPDC087230]|uniref:hypothetical protein n=2 Tax=unclassified Nocardia TaxID=2637762 RepID=UPI00380A1BC1
MQLPVPLRDTTRPLAAALTDADARRFTGILRVTGEPGGDIRCVDGRIVAVSTGGAPDFDALDPHDDAQPLGAARTRLLRMTATVDGTFAIAAGWIDRCHWIDAHPDVVAADDSGYDAEWLLGEAERRLAALAHAGFSPYRNLLALTDFGRSVREQGAELLRLVDGTRSCRDLAFLLGRPLYPVTVEVARLLGAGQLTVPARHAADHPPVPAGAGMVDPALPRRRRGASGINDTLRPRPPQAAPPSTTAVGVPDSSPRRRTERIS